ncbi:MAG: YkgJ family cysteine cluster protein [Oligoflexia bacterium]|nr:YkgJ family cysteine cluster protein [Oligoflexia bacterium]
MIDLFENYENFLKKIDETTHKINPEITQNLNCQRGCSSCCRSEIQVNKIEKEYIKKYLNQNPLIQQKISLSQKQKNKCSFLLEDESCSIYEARPVICRTHGYPILIENNIDICPLNASSIQNINLKANDILKTNTIELILAAISEEKFPRETKRTPLEVKEILS